MDKKHLLHVCVLTFLFVAQYSSILMNTAAQKMRLSTSWGYDHGDRVSNLLPKVRYPGEVPRQEGPRGSLGPPVPDPLHRCLFVWQIFPSLSSHWWRL